MTARMSLIKHKPNHTTFLLNLNLESSPQGMIWTPVCYQDLIFTTLSYEQQSPWFSFSFSNASSSFSWTSYSLYLECSLSLSSQASHFSLSQLLTRNLSSKKLIVLTTESFKCFYSKNKINRLKDRQKLGKCLTYVR